MMNRRHLLVATAGIIGASISKATRATPCTPPALSLDGTETVATSCGTPQGTAAWLQGKPLLTWFQIPGTSVSSAQTGYSAPGGSKAGIVAYSGAALKRSGSEVFLNGGGHGDYAGNEVVSLKLSNDAPSWQLRRTPTQSYTPDGPRNGDGRPSARHTFHDIQYSNERDRMMLVGGIAVYPNTTGGSTSPYLEMFNPTANDWDHVLGIEHPNLPSGAVKNTPSPVCQDGSGNVWQFNSLSGGVFRWNSASDTWTTLPNQATAAAYANCAAYDPVRNRIVIFAPVGGGWIDPATYASTGTKTAIAWGSLGEYPSAVWCADRNSFLVMSANSGTIREVNPSSYAISTLGVAGSTPSASPGSANWVGGRFFYAPELRVCGYIVDATSNIYIFRTG